ncbi:MAG: hypothetical protein A3I11_03730 [Elusimicrobia bacterium RIFCSPLOWO2_02_FULL_39_32]|nr:MAG: hypothetical protein A2034_00460 [Elusimicrobia bacterium GWA2_38_7]OGR79491.1 MAG: hypothetical protein A3B80_02300 [Elusimicrobia bacterium RIFCSPHIGHO2_02_FULL_39_36]OGR92818.1 MAG: hypothetical protein A3I11_03730 [Elusimicrobia bacterium RIFCSPLOWO2_02_FULL_39_32]OGR99602.1 MAG: hypothetical protein A3G85_01085 [Elusimicrobia bacterium RIFCSPLOWO2_12_FULL_39_28]
MDKKQLQFLIILIPILIIGINFGFYKYLFNPLSERKKILKGELEQIKKEYQESVGRTARLPKLQEEIAVLNQEILEVEKKLPKDKDVPSLIRLLSKKMDSHSIRWTRLAPGNQTSKDYYIEHTYTIPFSASYHNLATFLTEIGQLERIFSSRFSKLSSTVNSKTGENEVSGELTFLIYTSKG